MLSGNLSSVQLLVRGLEGEVGSFAVHDDLATNVVSPAGRRRRRAFQGGESAFRGALFRALLCMDEVDMRAA